MTVGRNSVGSIALDLNLNSKQFDSQLTGITGLAKKAGTLIAGAFAVKKLVDFGKQCVELGSNLNEVQNVVDVTFGAMSSRVNTFAQDAITAFGISETTAKKYMGTFGAMSKAFGYSSGQAYEMGAALTGLSGDVASFYNLSTDEAYTKLKSVFTGETESLKDLGVVMTQNALDAYAMANGYGKVTAKMTEQEKVGLRLAFVQDKLSLASGDFARTSGSWANQVRVLSLQFDQFKATIGQGLINVFTPVIQVINTLLSKLMTLATAFRSFTAMLFGDRSGAGGAAETMGDLAGSVEGVGESAAGTAKQVKASLAGFDELNVLNEGGDGGGGGAGMSGIDMSPTIDTAPAMQELDALTDKFKAVADAIKAYYDNNLARVVKQAIDRITASAAKLVPTFKKVWEDIVGLGEPLKEWFNGSFVTYLQTWVTTWGTIVSGLLDTFNLVFSDIWNIVIAPTLQKWATDILPLLTNIGAECLSTLGVLFENVKMLFDTLWSEGVAPALALIQQIWSDMWDGIIAAWEEHGKPIFDGIRELIQNVADTLKNVWDAIIKPVWDKFMEVVTELWDNHLKPLWDNILDLVGSWAEALLAYWNNVLLPLVNWFISVFGPNIANAFNIVLQVAGTVIGGITDLINGIITILKGLMTFLTGVFTGDWEKAWQGIVGIFKGIFDAVGGIAKGVINIVIDVINGMMSAVASGINTVIRAINKLSFKVPDWVLGIGGESFGFNIKTVSAPQIPHLANGGYVQANTPQLAMIGDNKTQGEVVAPENKLAELLKAAVSAGGGNSQVVALLKAILELMQSGAVMLVDGRELGRLALDEARRSNESGYRAIKI